MSEGVTPHVDPSPLMAQVAHGRRKGPPVRRSGPRAAISGDVAILVGSQVGALALSFALTPFQLHAMGRERYGIVAVTAALVGYLAFFDVGVGWALTHFVPHSRAAGRDEELRRLIFAGLVISLTMGLAACVATWVCAPWLSQHVLRISPGAMRSARISIRLAGLSIPVVLVTSVFLGIGRGLGLFRHNGILRFAGFAALNILWAAVAHSGRAVELVAAAQLVISAVVLLAWIAVVRAHMTGPLLSATADRSLYTRLLRYGSYSSMSSMGYLLLNAADKVILAAIVPIRDIAYYAVPFTLASQIPVVSITVALVLFPRLSAAAGAGASPSIDGSESHEMAEASRDATTLFNAAATFACLWLGPSFLKVWLGADFADHAAFVLRALGLGFGVLALGSVDQVFLQAHGRVRLSAAIFLLCGTAGTVALVVLANISGISGAAVATGAALALIGLGHMIASARLQGGAPLRTLASGLRKWLMVGAAGTVIVFVTTLVRSSWIGAVVGAIITLFAVAATARLARGRLNCDSGPRDQAVSEGAR